MCSLDEEIYSNIGYCVALPITDVVKMYLKVKINFNKIKFIFLEIDSFYVPFEINEIIKKKTYFEIKLLDFDVLKKLYFKKINVYLTQALYNESVLNFEVIDIRGFSVKNDKDEECGEVSDVYDINMNKCFCIRKGTNEKIIPYNKIFIKSVDIKNKCVFISKDNI